MNRAESIENIFKKLDHLEKGQRICFKRNCGKTLHEVDTNTRMQFYRLTAGESAKWNEDRLFAALCIHSLWEPDERNRKPMDEAISTLVHSSGGVTDSFMKRVITIMDTEWDSSNILIYKITRMAKILKQKGLSVDGASLALDFMNWNHSGKSVQKRWARTLCN